MNQLEIQVRCLHYPHFSCFLSLSRLSLSELTVLQSRKAHRRYLPDMALKFHQNIAFNFKTIMLVAFTNFSCDSIQASSSRRIVSNFIQFANGFPIVFWLFFVVNDVNGKNTVENLVGTALGNVRNLRASFCNNNNFK